MSRLDELVEAHEIQSNVSLAAMTTYKFGGPARWFIHAENAAALTTAVSAAIADDVPYLIVGRGSNLVVSDAGFDGLAIKLAGSFGEIEIAADGSVGAGAAVPLPKLARACAKSDRGGLEFLVAVPGSVGGAVRMNAGCHGSETSDWLLSVDVFRPGVGDLTIERSAMDMSYRANSLPATDIVLAALFRTEGRPQEESEEIMRAITQWRKDHQPGGTFNAGSVFKNPAETSAGWLIDSLGLKGFAVGGARVSDRHANFFEADAGTSAQDLHDLVWAVKERVAAERGIELEPEIRFVGDFEIDREELTR